ncbi:MAG: YlmC/YmxH family sporulation protein [Bacillota bacterium]
MIKISDLRMREVINVVDGRRMGEIKDIELDLEKGRVKSIILPGVNRFFRLFSRNEDIIVPWEKIKKLGIDVILVEVHNFTDPKHEEL